MAEEKWILDSVEFTPQGNVKIYDENDNTWRHIFFNFKCPHCSYIYKHCLEGKIRFRKCRICNKPVKSYGKNLPSTILVSKDKNDITIAELKNWGKDSI